MILNLWPFLVIALMVFGSILSGMAVAALVALWDKAKVLEKAWRMSVLILLVLSSAFVTLGVAVLILP